MKLKREEENQRLKEEQIKEEEEKIKENQKELDEKDSLIERKKKEIANLTNILEDVYISSRKRFEEEKKNIEEDLEKYKKDAIGQFLTIKLINEKIKDLALNKDPINSVTEIINELSLDYKFIKDKQFFEEIIKEYENVINEIQQSNGHAEKIYKKYGLEPNLFKNNENDN